jgi:hypothetical protein
MVRWQRAYLSACAALIGGCLAYALCDFLAWPRLTYFPLEHDWRLASGSSGAIGSSYLGMVLWGVSGAAVAGIVTWLLLGTVRRTVSERWLGLAGAWAASALILGGLYFTWKEWPF